MEIKPIKTEADYRAAVAEIERLMDIEDGSPDGDRLDILATLVEAYEAKHHPIDLPDPIAAIKFIGDLRAGNPRIHAREDVNPAMPRHGGLSPAKQEPVSQGSGIHRL